MFKRLILLILLSILSISASPLSWQTFSNGKLTWICSSSSVYVFSSDSRTTYPLVLDQVRTISTIADVVKNENNLLFSTDAGIYQLDMATQSIERISFPEDKNKAGKIAADMDYLWLATNDTLYRFDNLGREWSSYALPEKININVLRSDGVNVECLGKNEVFDFTINTEKWNKYSTGTLLNDSVSYVPGLKSYIAVSEKQFFIYKADAHSWERNETEFPISDIIADDTVLFYSTGDRVMKMSNGISRAIDIPTKETIYALGKSSDTLLIALKSRIMRYNLKTSNVDFVELSAQVATEKPEKIIGNSFFIVTMYPEKTAIYNSESKTWIVANCQQKNTSTKFSWREQGPMIQYKPNFYTNIKGYIESKTSLKSAGFIKDTTIKRSSEAMTDGAGNILRDSDSIAIYKKDTLIDSTLLLKWLKPDLIANINIHSSDPDGRTLDLAFDNSNPSVPAKKNLSYKGISTDRLNSLKGGTCQSDIMQSQLSTPVQFEGVQLGIESKSKVEGRDRKIAKFGTGAGFITSKSQWKVIRYRADGIYSLTNDTTGLLNDSLKDTTTTDIQLGTSTTLKIKDTTQIIPGSLRVWVDGTVLDSTYYTFFSSTATLKIEPTAPIDPVSLISISYKIQPLPEYGNEQIEFIPQNNFGKIYYGTTTISPLNWLSLRVGVETLDKDTSLQTVINTALPFEYRNDNPALFVKCTPEFSMDVVNKSKAGAIDFQSRVGQHLGLTFNGLLADSNFATADTFTRGYGQRTSEYEVGVNYDILPQIPVQYSQHQYIATHGSELNYSAHTGAHFARFPFFDFNISRTILNSNNSDTASAFDSLFHIKDRIVFKLFETSSPFVEHFLHLKKVAYDLTHTEYRYQEFESDSFLNGRRTDAKLTLNPLQSITLNGRTTVKNGDLGNGVTSSIEPSLEILTFDAPVGVDIYGLYKFAAAKYTSADSTTDGIERGLGLTLRPGQWYKPIRWLSVYGTLNESINCIFDRSDPGFSDLLSGVEDSSSSTLTKTAGFNIFPNQSFYFRNKNQWVDRDTIKRFVTTNNMQVQFNAKNILDNSLSYNTDYTYYNLSGSTKHTYKFLPWLQLSPEIKGQYLTDSTGTKLSAGPALSTSISTNRWMFIKNIFNDQSVGLTWNRVNNHTENYPDFSYSFRLDLVLLPNIKISNQEILSYKNGSFDNFTGTLYCAILF
jgi:hypothetical protein